MSGPSESSVRDDLLARLNARLDEAERVAKAATPSADPYPGGWNGFSLADDDGRAAMYAGPTKDGYRTGTVFEFMDFDECDACVRPSSSDVSFIAAWSPDVALRMVAATREVLERHTHQQQPGIDWCGECGRFSVYPCFDVLAWAKAWGVAA